MSKRSRPPSQRQLRVGEEIRHALALVFERDELRHPELAAVSITVSEVRASPDLKQATAFIAPLGGGDTAAILAALGLATPYLRRRVAELVRLRHVPKLQFEPDTSFDYAQQIDQIIEKTRPVEEPTPDAASSQSAGRLDD